MGVFKLVAAASQSFRFGSIAVPGSSRYEIDCWTRAAARLSHTDCLTCF